MKKNIFSIVVGFLFLAINYYFSGFNGFFGFIIFFLSWLFIFYGLYLFINFVNKKQSISLKNYTPKFSFWFFLVNFIIFSFATHFFYYHNEIIPAKMPTYTLTNGKKTIVFQGMAHIGGDNFYKQVKSDIEKYKKDNYSYFYEGVKLTEKAECIDYVAKKIKETPECLEEKKKVQENLKKFDKILGLNFSEDMYEKIAKFIGIKAQDQSQFLNLVNKKDINTDLSISKIISLYEARYGTGVYSNSGETISLGDDIFEEINKLNDREKWLVRYIYKGIINSTVNDSDLASVYDSNMGKLMNIIIDDRNKNLVNSIKISKEEKIYITYGLLHFEGIYNLLKESDVNWVITEIKFKKLMD